MKSLQTHALALAKALLRRRRISSILIYILDMPSNTVNWGLITGPDDFLPPLPSTDDLASLDAGEESDPFASDSPPPPSLP